MRGITHSTEFELNSIAADLESCLDDWQGAQIGHDGFDSPGGGSYYHQLHHAHFECNYGDAAFPTDWLFGTFEDGSRWASKKRKEQ